MHQPGLQVLRFADYEIDERLLELRKSGRVVDLARKPFLLLLYLVKNADRVVTRDEILREVWNGAHVAEGALRTAMSELRRALEDSGHHSKWIQTLTGRGYRFLGKVETAI